MAFSEEEVAAWDPQVWATERVDALCEQYRLAVRRSELPDMPKPTWWKEVADRLYRVATWYCVRLEIPGVDLEGLKTLPAPSSAEGKRLTAQALTLDEEGFASDWLNVADVCMGHVVTRSRRAVGRAKGADKKRINKAGNRLANAINNERGNAEKALAALASRSG